MKADRISHFFYWVVVALLVQNYSLNAVSQVVTIPTGIPTPVVVPQISPRTCAQLSGSKIKPVVRVPGCTYASVKAVDGMCYLTSCKNNCTPTSCGPCQTCNKNKGCVPSGLSFPIGHACKQGCECSTNSCANGKCVCRIDAQCGNGNFCNHGACQSLGTPQPIGSPCARNAQCATNFCAGGICGCVNDSQCSADHSQFCSSGKCASSDPQPAGKPCVSSRNCTSGNCTNGLCMCNTVKDCGSDQVCSLGSCDNCDPKQSTGSKCQVNCQCTTDFCNQSVCQCQSDGQCSSGEKCVTGSCIAKCEGLPTGLSNGTTCNEDCQCTDGNACIDDYSGNVTCSPKYSPTSSGYECGRDSQCQSNCCNVINPACDTPASDRSNCRNNGQY